MATEKKCKVKEKIKNKKKSSKQKSSGQYRSYSDDNQKNYGTGAFDPHLGYGHRRLERGE